MSRRIKSGPVRLSKSGGEFSPKNILAKIKNPISRTEKFTAGSCLPYNSPDRPNIRNMSCNYGQCPAGYTSVGYDGTQWNYGSACTMYNMICVKSDYDKTTPQIVAGCCNGTIAQKDCDPTLCRGSQSCRDKMLQMCDSADNFGSPACQTWLNAPENSDIKPAIMSKYCKVGDLGSGPCRDFAMSGGSFGLMDNTVSSWCTGKVPNPTTIDPKLSEYTRWRLYSGPEPQWLQLEYLRSTPAAVIQSWDFKMQIAAATFGPTEVANPTVTYRDNSKDPICSCILSSLNKLGDKSPPPSCFDSSCRNGGYQTAAMKSIAGNCPSWVECRSSVLAAAGGVNSDIKVNQICGEPPAGTYIAPTPMTTPGLPTSTPIAPAPTPSGVKDDKTLLKEDEARATVDAGSPNPTPIVTTTTPGLSEQLAAPFAPALFGDASVAMISMLFFTLIILAAIVYRVWMNHQVKKMIAGQYEAALRYDRDLEMADKTAEIQKEISGMNLTRVGGAA